MYKSSSDKNTGSANNLTALLGLDNIMFNKKQALNEQGMELEEEQEEDTICRYKYNNHCKKYLKNTCIIIMFIGIIIYYICGMSYLFEEHNTIQKCKTYNLIWYVLYLWCGFPLVTTHIIRCIINIKTINAISGIIINLTCITLLFVDILSVNYNNNNCKNLKNTNFFDYIIITIYIYIFITIILIIILMISIALNDCYEKNKYDDKTNNTNIKYNNTKHDNNTKHNNNEQKTCIDEMDCTTYNNY